MINNVNNSTQLKEVNVRFVKDLIELIFHSMSIKIDNSRMYVFIFIINNLDQLIWHIIQMLINRKCIKKNKKKIDNFPLKLFLAEN